MQSGSIDWPLPIIHLWRCVGCGTCVRSCPSAALGLSERHVAIVHPECCSFCEVCEQVCPTGAIERPFVIRFEAAEQSISE